MDYRSDRTRDASGNVGPIPGSTDAASDAEIQEHWCSLVGKDVAVESQREFYGFVLGKVLKLSTTDTNAVVWDIELEAAYLPLLRIS
ncbi:MAG: hypothetical protein SGARI_005766 [Bacillariaceae sp.]